MNRFTFEYDLNPNMILSYLEILLGLPLTPGLKESSIAEVALLG
jgi:hypothetical protein